MNQTFYPDFLTPEKLTGLERLRDGLDAIQNAIDRWNDLNAEAGFPSMLLMLWQAEGANSAYWKANEDIARKITAHHIDRIRFEHKIAHREAA